MPQTNPSDAADRIPQPSKLPSHAIPVRRFEMKLVWPVLLQWKRESNGTILPADADPDLPDNSQFFEHWCQVIQDHPDWTEVGGAYPPLTGPESAPGYAEFCYFHPFVRNFLYVNRDDIRQSQRKSRQESGAANGQSEDPVAAAINRSLRVFSRRLGARNETDPAKKRGRLTLEYSMDPYPLPEPNESKDDADKKDAIDTKQGGFRRITTEFDIRSCWLYLFDTQIALLELDLQYDPDLNPDIDLNLRMVLKIQDIIRRLYAPYFDSYSTDDGEIRHTAGHCPERLSIRFADSEPPITSSYGHFTLPVADKNEEQEDQDKQKDKDKENDNEKATPLLTTIQNGEFDLAKKHWKDVKSKLNTPPDNATPEQTEQRLRELAEAERQLAGIEAAKAHREFVYQNREPYSVEVYRELLKPIEPTTNSINEAGPSGSKLRFEQIQDDRIPLMSFIAVDDPRKITEGDWQRLAVLDDEGNSFAWPYSPRFVGGDPLREFAYDRFWSDDEQLPAQAGFHGTRWLCSGYSFSGVGRAGDPYFFCNDHSGAASHFGHHYFALFMVAQFHRASLLRYKHALAEAADELLNGEESIKALRVTDFRQRCQRLSEEFLRFRTRYWFSEVSNQIQGRELFDMFRKHLELQKLFDDVKDDVESTDAILKNWDEESQARSSRYLAILGAVFLAVGPALALFSERWKITNPFGFGFVLMVAIGGLILGFWEPAWKPPKYQRWRRWIARLYHQYHRIFCRACLAVGLLAGASLLAGDPLLVWNWTRQLGIQLIQIIRSVFQTIQSLF